MRETMYNAKGCGLAASRIGIPIKLFVVDSKTAFENFEEADRETYFDKGDNGIMETFINAEIMERSAETSQEEEGCLSIPGLSQKISRSRSIQIEHFNKDFEKQIKTFSGTTARMIQHEYDHTLGISYLDYLKPLTRKLMDSNLKKIIKGQINPKYPMKFSG